MRFSISDEELHLIGSNLKVAVVPGEEYKDVSNTNTLTDIFNVTLDENICKKSTFVTMNEIRQEVEEYFSKMCLKSERMKQLKEEIITELHAKRQEEQKARVEMFTCPVSPTKEKNLSIDDLKLDESIKIMLPEDWLNNDFDFDYSFDSEKYNLKCDDLYSKYISEADCAVSGGLPSESTVTEEINWKVCTDACQLFEDTINIEKPKVRKTSSDEVLECLYECEYKYSIVKDLRTFYESCLKRIDSVYTESIVVSHRHIKRWLNEFFNSDRCLSHKDEEAEARHVLELYSFLSGNVILEGNITYQVKDILELDGGLELIMFDFFNKVLHMVTSGTGAQQWIKKLLLYILNKSTDNLNLFYAYMMNIGFNYRLIKPNLDKLGTQEFGVPIKVSDDRKIMKFFIIINLNVKVPKTGFLFQSGFEFFKTLYKISKDFPQIPIFPVVYINALFEKDFISTAISNFNENKWINSIKKDMAKAIMDVEYYQQTLGESLSAILASLYYEIRNSISIG